jgi:signal transduction histidine kinase/CheY-like chemotaxis protein/CHASE1-domain containing sensor protein
MEAPLPPKQDVSGRRKILPYAVLVVFLFITASSWRHWSDAEEEKDRHRYDEYTRDIAAAITHRLNDYSTILHGGAGLFAVSDTVTGEQWRAYFRYRQIRTLLPIIHGVGVSMIVKPSEVAQHLHRMREEGSPEYEVRLAGKRHTYTANMYLEPFDAYLRRALGRDMYNDPVPRAAMELARDTAAVSISGNVALVTEIERDVQTGFLMFVPIYGRDRRLGSVAERRAALKGYVYGAFHIADLMRGIFPRPAHDIDLQVYDGTRVSPEVLLYGSDDARGALREKNKPLFSSRKVLDLYGRQWTLAFATRPPFEAMVDHRTSRGFLATGIIISLLAFLFIRTQENTRERAFSLAHEMTLALRRSEEQYRVLNDSLPVGVSIIGRNMEIIAANATIGKWFPENDYGQHPPCYAAYNLPPRMEPCAACPVVKTFQDGQVHTAEREVATSGGTRTVFMTSMPLAGPDGRIMSVHETVEDITERRQVERERIARGAAEEASRAKSNFVANMSHEIRTPMNAIMGFAQVLERDATLTPRQLEHVRIITRSGAHLLKLINDILDMSKIEAGRITLNETSFCLHDLLGDLELMFRSRADAKGLQLLMERDESVPRFVTADESKLRQILINLMGNAVKFTATGGLAVRLRAAAVAGATAESGEVLRLVAEVQDSGPGISEEDMGRIFGAFQQADSGLKAGGTGLGLAISRKFVEIMGGELTVMSEVGRGSCFRFEVLLRPAEEVAEREIPPSHRVVGLESGLEPRRILVVDDVPTNRAFLCEMLRPVGFEVAEAGNGVEALELFEHWSPHAVLMDMRMPIMDGYEATKRIKSTPAGRDTPIIAITASAFDDSRKQVMAAGVDGYLRKPFRHEELFDALGKSLGLRYVFAGEAEGTSGHPEPPPDMTQSLAELPKQLLEEMRQSVAEGDMASLEGLIRQVETRDRVVAGRLRAFADRYDYEKLVQWLDSHEVGNG